MAATLPLSAEMTQRTLHHFGIPISSPPNLTTLRQLLNRYTRTVPWESASRIVRRARYKHAADCAILGAEFWESHFTLGTGGTCYESNYAFFALLLRLGYDGYLTINDMGATIGCHSAIVLLLDGQKVLVDVGLPLQAVLPLHADQTTISDSAFLRYTAEPQDGDRYQILQQPHPRSQAFQLVDTPVADADYRAIAVHDYRHEGGQFLNEIVISKVVDEQLWRFNSDERPLRLQQFVDGQRRDHPLGGDVAGELAAKFGLARDTVAEAIELLGIDDG